ncbi:MAG: N-acetylmuramoyl-L-alanine amidase [Synechococcus sp. BS307-5m-G37]|nr:N-acetylmuramoyl-L-alanine amidase [Synechococcus sp. BS307-5m-G37]
MMFIRSPLVVLALIILSGCSRLPFRLPWQSDGDPQQPWITGEFNTNDDEEKQSKAETSKKGVTLPPLMELADASLTPASEQEIANCASAIGLGEEEDQLADPTNYGNRIVVDEWKRLLQADPLIIVLHETVISEKATLAFFQTPHLNDADQASYHMLIARDGARLRIVPDEKRAYGAGMSAFGDVTQRTKSTSVGSINNIALHVSLVSPEDGRDDRSGHSGYTQAQYRNLAAQVLLWQAKFGIPLTRLTTHEAIDRSHSRYDPRSFRWDRFDPEYQQAARLCGFERFDNGQAGL